MDYRCYCHSYKRYSSNIYEQTENFGPFLCPISYSKFLSIFEKQEIRNVYVSFHVVIEHNPSNDLTPISAL